MGTPVPVRRRPASGTEALSAIRQLRCRHFSAIADNSSPSTLIARTSKSAELDQHISAGSLISASPPRPVSKAPSGQKTLKEEPNHACQHLPTRIAEADVDIIEDRDTIVTQNTERASDESLLHFQHIFASLQCEGFVTYNKFVWWWKMHSRDSFRSHIDDSTLQATSQIWQKYDADGSGLNNVHQIADIITAMMGAGLCPPLESTEMECHACESSSTSSDSSEGHSDSTILPDSADDASHVDGALRPQGQNDEITLAVKQLLEKLEAALHIHDRQASLQSMKIETIFSTLFQHVEDVHTLLRLHMDKHAWNSEREATFRKSETI